MSRLKAEELAKEISNFVNGASVDEVEQLAYLMSKDHPTLQQSTMRLACLFIQEMAKKQYTDARNKQSKEIAIAMVNGYKSSAIEEIIKQDGSISTSLRTYIEEEGVPSKSLGLI